MIAYNFVNFILFCYLINLVQSYKSVSRETKLLNPVERIFTRKRRFIVFPNYCSMKITVAGGKHLISKYPKSTNLSMELSLYYPVPTVLEEWYPKPFRAPAKPKPTVKRLKIPPVFKFQPRIVLSKMKSTTPMTPNIMKMMETMMMNRNNSRNGGFINPYPFPLYSSESGNIFIPDMNNQTYNYYYRHPYQNLRHRDKMSHRWDGNYSFQNKERNVFNDRMQMGNRNRNYNNYIRTRNYKTLSNRRGQFPSERIAGFQGNYRRRQRPQYNYPRGDDVFTREPIYFPDLEPYRDWKHFRAHRDRRDFYTHLEGFGRRLGINLKACILRSICEAKRYLLPPGYSLIQDILRVFFSFPTLDGMPDEYSKIMRSDPDTCIQKLNMKCNFSILDLILNPTTVKS